MELYGIPWNYMEFHGIPEIFHENPWNPKGINSMEFNSSGFNSTDMEFRIPVGILIEICFATPGTVRIWNYTEPAWTDLLASFGAAKSS